MKTRQRLVTLSVQDASAKFRRFSPNLKRLHQQVWSMSGPPLRFCKHCFTCRIQGVSHKFARCLINLFSNVHSTYFWPCL